MKNCPFLNHLESSGECVGEYCAWWDDERKQCAIVSINQKLSEHNEE